MISGSTPRAYDHFDAELTIGAKQDDTEKEIDPDGFFYSDFEARFYLTSDDTKTSKTTFNVADNIIFDLESFAPSTANSVFDRVEITSVSNPEVIEVSGEVTGDHKGTTIIGLKESAAASLGGYGVILRQDLIHIAGV